MTDENEDLAQGGVPMLVWESPAHDSMAWAKNRAAILAWLRAHGIDPNKITARVVVLMDGDARTIHATEFLTNEAGHRYVDHYAPGAAATRPLVVPLRTDPPALI